MIRKIFWIAWIVWMIHWIHARGTIVDLILWVFHSLFLILIYHLMNLEESIEK